MSPKICDLCRFHYVLLSSGRNFIFYDLLQQMAVIEDVMEVLYPMDSMIYLFGTDCATTGLFAGNSPVTGEFHSQRPVMLGFNVFFHLRLNKRLSNQSRRLWFETPSDALWRHGNETVAFCVQTLASEITLVLI